MNTHIFTYEGFAQFEVVLAAYFLATKGNITTVGISTEPVTSEEGFRTLPDTTLADISAEAVEVFIIPGGDPELLFGVDRLYTLLGELNRKKVPIAAICGGTVHLAKAGILKGRNFTTPLQLDNYSWFDKSRFENTPVVVDGNIITAKPNGYVDFALEIGRIMDIYKDDSDYEETVRFFKEFKDA